MHIYLTRLSGTFQVILFLYRSFFISRDMEITKVSLHSVMHNWLHLSLVWWKLIQFI